MSVTAAAEIDANARALASRWRGGNRLDPGLRASCSAELARLRDVFRARPELFGQAALTALKEVSGALKTRVVQLAWRPPPVAEGAARGVLRDVFGFDAFRAGQ